jgi:GrpB-like predicted nucleotidyltransferase (UPF0157 family)
MVPYDPAWPAAFEAHKVLLESALAPALSRQIDHIGSTAIPGLVAKAIVDMLAVVRNVEAARACVPAIEGVGWVAAPESTDEMERRLSFCFPSVERRTNHLHVVEESSDVWRGWIAFRGYLRAHPEVADEYGTLKSRLALEHGANPNDRDAYRAGKAEFIRETTATALGE